MGMQNYNVERKLKVSTDPKRKPNQPNRTWRRRLKWSRNTGKPPTIPGTLLLSAVLSEVTCEPIHEMLRQPHPPHWCGGPIQVSALEGPRVANPGELITIRNRTNPDRTHTIAATIRNHS